MTRPRTRPLSRGAAAACVLVSLATLTACGAGPDAQTQKYYAPGDGVNAVVPPMRVLNALVVAPGEGGADALLSMTLSNDSAQPETLTEVLTDRFGPVRLAGERTVPARGTVLFGGQTAQAQGVLPGFTGKAGEVVSLSIRFARSSPVENLRTVVVPATGYYGDLQLRPPAPPAPSGSATAAPTGTGAPTVTAPVNPAGSAPVTNVSPDAGVGGAEPDEPGGE